MKKHVLLVERDRRLRTQLVSRINGTDDLNCFESHDSSEKIFQESNIYPDVILMDINLPERLGIKCLPRIQRRFPQTGILMLADSEDTDAILVALRSGAEGCLLKSSPPEKLLDAIRDVHSGRSSFCSHVAKRMIRHLREKSKGEAELSRLSPREREVLELISKGHRNKEVAAHLNIGAETVRTLLKRICFKLGVRTRIEAVVKFHS